MTDEKKREINGLAEGVKILGITGDHPRVPELQNLAMAVKQSCNGSADPMRSEDLLAIRKYIKLRLEIWRDPTDPMDEAVKTMCNHCLWIIDKELERGW